jgi:hypothetical protein
MNEIERMRDKNEQVKKKPPRLVSGGLFEKE